MISIHPSTQTPPPDDKKSDDGAVGKAFGKAATAIGQLMTGSPAGAAVPTQSPAAPHPPKIDSKPGRHVALDGNNPGGMSDGKWAKTQVGYVGANGRYAAFDTIEHGEQAMQNLLRFYIRHGINTPAAITAKWAPKEDKNDPKSYAQQVARRMHVGVDDVISEKNIGAFQYAQSLSENSAYAKIATSASRQAYANYSGGVQMAGNTTTIGSITIHTQAKTPKGIVTALADNLERRGVVSSFNTGLRS